MSQTVSTVTHKKFISVLTVLLIVGFSTLMNETLFVIALPDIAKEFGVSTPAAAWTSTAYFLTMGIIVPLTAFYQQHFDLRKLFFFVCLLYLIGCLVGYFSTSFPLLLLGRVLQASGSAFVIPLANTLIIMEAPKGQVGFYNGLMFTILTAAPAIAPGISGVIITTLVWRDLFLVLMIPVIGAFFAGLFVIPKYIHLVESKLDTISILLDIAAFGGIILGIGNIVDYGFVSPVTSIPFGVGIISLFFFVKRQLRIKNPLLSLGIFKNPKFRFGIIFVPALFFAIFAIDIIMPLYLRSTWDLSALTTGLILLPCGIAHAIMSMVGGHAYDHSGLKIMPLGIVLSLIGAFLWLLGGTHPLGIGLFIFASVLLYGAAPLITAPSSTFAFTSLSEQNISHGIALNETSIQIFGALGIAINTVIFYSGPKLPWIDNLKGFNLSINGFESSVILTIIILLGLLLHYYKNKPSEPKITH